ACDGSPRTKLGAHSLKASRRRVLLSGRARETNCSGVEVASVELALARLVGDRCAFLSDKGRLGRAAPCTVPVFLRAHIRRGATVAKWSFAKHVRLPPGRYELAVRSTDDLGRTGPVQRKGFTIR
ncbi:MAG TPA: hypothetical protein VHE14_05000, partial [Solirubrobacteraceae bacterium]|nr:hypothetical protein [Solirubrobacteraceae bacterium]